jgi:polyphenol oxidase
LENKAVAIEAPGLAALRGIRHGFFTRRGGVSTGDYASLNCGLGSGDHAEFVLENRKRVAAVLGTARERLLTGHQVHSAVAQTVTGPWPDPTHRRPADALVSSTPGLALGALTADCAPVLFADPRARVVGAAHAGWKGALGGILESTLVAMETQGARRADIFAAVGPTIGPAHYEVGDEFEARFLAVDRSYATFFHRSAENARPYFDLPAFIVARLKAANTGFVEDLGRCTYAGESEFYSYRRMGHRREADYGRQISAIVLA